MKHIFILMFVVTMQMTMSSYVFAGSIMPKKSVIARFSSTSVNSDVAGKAALTEKKGGLEVKVSLTGVPAGQHGFHFHEYGSCGDQGKAAGGHFDPNHVKHGLLTKDGFTGAHAGDLGNIEAGTDGVAKLEIFLPKLNLSEGKYDVSGRSIILHEKKDNFGQPTGNAGGRIACALIPEA